MKEAEWLKRTVNKMVDFSFESIKDGVEYRTNGYQFKPAKYYRYNPIEQRKVLSIEKERIMKINNNRTMNMGSAILGDIIRYDNIYWEVRLVDPISYSKNQKIIAYRIKTDGCLSKENIIYYTNNPLQSVHRHKK